jgi:hypothetical protein
MTAADTPGARDADGQGVVDPRQHTPGPWAVEMIGQDDLYGHVYISGHVTSPLHTYCGNTVGRRDSIAAPDSMTWADAHLIAAAPLLLEALQKQQDVEDHELECLYCLHSDECTERTRLVADAGVAREDALATARPADDDDDAGGAGG